MRIGILAGESSGDILGAGLMQALKARHPDLVFEGIGGPLMEAHGLRSQVPMERLSVMGLVEPLKRLPELLRIRRKVIDHFISNPPALFIGIDSPDFNLDVELKLRAAGIKTVHYVSPSVWAWRRRRVHKIARAVDLVLTLFPFEADFYRQHDVNVCFVGHPLADAIPLAPDRQAARNELRLQTDGKVLALLPGSRVSEVSRLGPPFLQAASLMVAKDPALTVLLPCANAACRAVLQQAPEWSVLERSGHLRVFDGQSRLAMQAADGVLLASGTATLEALLFKLPMLVCYRMAPLSYAIISRLLKVPYFSLPNLLAGEKLVDELVQDQVQPAILASQMRQLLAAGSQNVLQQRYLAIHQALRRQASERAADAVLALT
ncbi:MAG TPA: lipid-A-disaccharide synthase [Candidatus Acidoferrum sp.]|nr:lipid-A-disaccharide synthase [Candidatus Acidoferrum sp.]